MEHAQAPIKDILRELRNLSELFGEVQKVLGLSPGHKHDPLRASEIKRFLINPVKHGRGVRNYITFAKHKQMTCNYWDIF